MGIMGGPARDGEPDVVLGLRHDPVVLPGRVYAGTLPDGGDQLYLGGRYRLTRTPVRLPARSRGDESGRVDLACQLGRGRPAWVMCFDHDPHGCPRVGCAGVAAATWAGAGGGAASPRRGGEHVVRVRAAQRAHVQPRSVASRAPSDGPGRGAAPAHGLRGAPPLHEGEDAPPSHRRPLGAAAADVDAVLLGDLPRRGDTFGAAAAATGATTAEAGAGQQARGGGRSDGSAEREDERDRLADGDDVACLRDACQDAGSRRLDWDGRSHSRSGVALPGARRRARGAYCRTLPSPARGPA